MRPLAPRSVQCPRVANGRGMSSRGDGVELLRVVTKSLCVFRGGKCEQFQRGPSAGPSKGRATPEDLACLPPEPIRPP